VDTVKLYVIELACLKCGGKTVQLNTRGTLVKINPAYNPG